MSEWISVDDRLPEDETHCLVYHPLWGNKMNLFWRGSFQYIGLNFDKPTHWMPLPEPPLESKDE